MSGVGFVTGLAAEAALLARLEAIPLKSASRIICAAADSARAAAAAESLILAGADALVSFGIAGGLDPALRPGALVLPECVVASGGETVSASESWRRAALDRAGAAGLVVTGGRLAGSDAALCHPVAKTNLRRRAGALAVDMESHAVGRAAERAGLPFLIVRAVADPAERALPTLVEGSIGPNGRPRTGLVMARLALAPWQLRSLLRLRRDAAAALAALSRAVEVLGPVLSSRP